jgi:carboxylate-amine ligase
MSARAPKAVPVREHRFGRGPEYTVGIEEELMLVRAGDLELAAASAEVVAAVGDLRVKPELMQSQIELASAPHAFAADAGDELCELRRRVIAACAPLGVRLAGAGTHAFSPAEAQPFTVDARYRELAAALRYPLRREACFGMHVHVAVADADKAVQVIEGMLGDLPLLLAASTSSPFWRGEPTGLHSTRTVIFQSLPRSGLPPSFATYEDFATRLEGLERAGAVADHSYLWWDARPHPRFGTVEVRVFDAQPCAADSAALAGLTQALVAHYGRRYDEGERFAADRFVVAENRWLAARLGLRAHLVDPGRGGVPARRLLAELAERIAPDAADVAAVAAVEALASRGTSAERQLALLRDGASIPEVVGALADEATRECRVRG